MARFLFVREAALQLIREFPVGAGTEAESEGYYQPTL